MFLKRSEEEVTRRHTFNKVDTIGNIDHIGSGSRAVEGIARANNKGTTGRWDGMGRRDEMAGCTSTGRRWRAEGARENDIGRNTQTDGAEERSTGSIFKKYL